ncbi:putative isomerase YbhE [Testicularia cyperi]|uniref:Putative isomerase YbhE n=1 Tax=Testicularia cyperi TaxID=1882483 RepID=A0A317XTH4_9BASI|nr:putative isomerase YbhE [Testicularia cyperi]
MKVFVAGYAGTIQPYAVDETKAAFVKLGSGIEPNSSGSGPSWIAFSSSKSADGDRLYSVSEGIPGRIFSHTFDSQTNAIVKTGTEEQKSNGTSTNGDGPVSALIGHGNSANLLFVANYNDGVAAVLSISPKNGTLSQKASKEDDATKFQFTRPASAPAVGPVPDRQDHSYAHQVAIIPTTKGDYVYVCDLGADQIHRLHIDAEQAVTFVASTDVPAGSGPRHITFHKEPDGRVYGYLASELSNTVTSFSVNVTTGELTALQEPILASPPDVPLSGPGILSTNRTTAEIALPPAGDFVYISNRGDETEDHISIFSRDTAAGTIKFQEWIPSGGRMPRHFSLSSDAGDTHAKWLAVGHQTDENIVLYQRDAATGKLKKKEIVSNVGPVAFTGFSPF